MNNYLRGLKAGIPIGLGYLSVSFTFGIAAISYGLNWWQAILVSMTTVTSAGQFAGIGMMAEPGLYWQMLISQITINIRYSFMSISIGHKADEKFKGIYRWLLGFFMTDEIFAVASQEESVKRSIFLGLSTIPYIGWSAGTAIGALLGNILPARIMSALALAIYGMFIAIVVPEMKKAKPVIFAVVLAFGFSSMFYYIPLLKKVSSGLSISICAIAAALICAVLFPVSGEDGSSDKSSNLDKESESDKEVAANE
ncbi:MAG: AzlC family ABC transporter permease [Lachnospiraceae bacterium]|nr:AzlC family ABC transporter permease [Lachnospiraceae bacterium]